MRGERMMYSGKKLDHRAGEGAARSPFVVCLEAADWNAPRLRVTPIITPFQHGLTDNSKYILTFHTITLERLNDNVLSSYTHNNCDVFSIFSKNSV